MVVVGVEVGRRVVLDEVETEGREVDVDVVLG